MKKYLINFIGAYMIDHGKIHSKHKLLSKKVNFIQLETNHMRKKSFIFRFVGGVEISIQVFILGPSETA